MATEMSRQVGRRIRQRRLEMNLKQRQLADLLESDAVDGQRVSDWERGVNQPSERYLKMLAAVMDRDVAWFYEKETETPDPFAATPDTELADRLDRIEQSIRDARTERAQAAEEIRRLLAEQADLLATIRMLVERLGIPDGITLQDHVIETVRDAAARSERPERRTRS